MLILVPFLFVFRWLLAMPLKQKLSSALSTQKLKFQPISLLRFLPDILLGLVLMLVVLALARPQKVNTRIERFSEGIDIVLALDISESMIGEDLLPNRLESAKKVAQDFINGRFSDRIGLVVFAGEAFSLVPLTTDYTLLEGFINEIDFSLIQKKGTAIGSAIAVATNRMKISDAKSKVMILLSDGDNTAGNLDPQLAAQLAKQYNIKIYTILIGKQGKVPIGKDKQGIMLYDDNTIDETTLKNIAKTADGSFFRAANNETLQEIFAKISKYETTEILETRNTQTRDFYQVYLAWAVVFWLIWLILKATFINNFLED